MLFQLIKTWSLTIGPCFWLINITLLFHPKWQYTFCGLSDFLQMFWFKRQALLRCSCKSGAYYSIGRTNREERSNQGSTVPLIFEDFQTWKFWKSMHKQWRYRHLNKNNMPNFWPTIGLLEVFSNQNDFVSKWRANFLHKSIVMIFEDLWFFEKSKNLQ